MQPFFLIILFLGFSNGIAVRQFSDDGCTQLSRLDYVSKTNCYSFSSTGSYFIKTCNCTLIEYNLYDGAMCVGNLIGTLYTQQNTCMSTRQMISCYEDKSYGDMILNDWLLSIGTFLCLMLS